MTRKSPIKFEENPAVKERRFRREEHLKGRKEIKEVFSEGKRFNCGGAKLFVLKNNLPHNRICFALSRGFGNAVARNRARRLSREAFRLIKPRLNSGYDLILLIYAEIPAEPKMALSGRMKQINFLFTKAGLMK